MNDLMYGSHDAPLGGIAAGAALGTTGYHPALPLLLTALVAVALVIVVRTSRASVRTY